MDQLDQERLAILIQDLASRVTHMPTPIQAEIELGRFVEEVHYALADTLSFSRKEDIYTWRMHLQDSYVPTFDQLYGIYRRRNLAGHANPDMHELTPGQVERDLDTIKELVPRLAQRLGDQPFVDRLYESQAGSRPQLRGQRLLEALGDLARDERVFECAMALASTYLSERQRTRKLPPPEHRMKWLVSTLAARLRGSEGDLLSLLAEHLESKLGAELDLSAVKAWREKDPGLARAASFSGRLKVIRVTLDRDPASPDDLLLVKAGVLEPPLPGQQKGMKLPRRISEGRLYEEVAEVCNVLLQNLREQVGLSQIQPAQFVLQIDVPDELATNNLEWAKKPSVPGYTLASRFRCVVLKPRAGYAKFRASANKPISHPQYEDNSISRWDPSEPAELLTAMQGKDCLFTGPWSCEDGFRTVLDAFEGYPCAVLHPAASEQEAMRELFCQSDTCTWEEILARVTEARRKGVAIRVLWDDLAYDPPLAESA